MSMAADPKALQQLRGVVGDGPPDLILETLLARHKNDVEASANAFFDQSASGPAPPPQQESIPVARRMDGAQPPPSDLVSVAIPPGIRGGELLQVQTANGLMHVRVPQGLHEGQTFLMRTTPPPGQAAPVARAVPSNHGQSSYPGLEHQPQVIIQQPPPVIVHASPYYHGGYYDPFFPMAGGLLGGMLIADALWW